MTGGYSIYYLQKILQDYGFNVYLYKAFERANQTLCGDILAQCGEFSAECSPEVFVKNPFDYLRATYLPYGYNAVSCGELLAQCGEPIAECGNITYNPYYPLVNKIPIETPDYTVLCGENIMECGENAALCGEFEKIVYTYKDYRIPDDENSWRFFIYIAGEIFPEPAKIEISRQEEFEYLIMRLFPAYGWRGVIVDFI